ncbi:MAG: pyruvate kinase alpha/beta domain-containing protein [Thermodesulfovibrionales bacterium]|nr:pyruvate kinase alpha/beta domain-containing protein [Thermodesulfovibrionales bacterium]
MEKKVLYFEKPGRDNTSECLRVVKDAIRQAGHKHLVVASTGGETGVLFSHALKDTGINLVVVTHSAGFKEPNSVELSRDTEDEITGSGAKVFRGTMLTHSIDTAFSGKFSGYSLTQIVANTLRRFGEGSKVCCECVMMAADAGLIPEEEEVLAVAGTARGADTVLLVKSCASKRFLELKVLEILAKPRV